MKPKFINLSCRVRRREGERSRKMHSAKFLFSKLLTVQSPANIDLASEETLLLVRKTHMHSNGASAEESLNGRVKRELQINPGVLGKAKVK